MNETILNIVGKWLSENNYQGLYNSEEECGCVIDDLMSCGQPDLYNCLPGYIHKTDKDKSLSGYDYIICGKNQKEKCNNGCFGCIDGGD